MGLIIIYAILTFFFAFNFTMDYFNEQRKKKTTSTIVVILVGFLIVFPIGAIFWPFYLMRQFFNYLRN